MKYRVLGKTSREISSLPSWERGLKLQQYQDVHLGNPSLPSWERGLKLLSPQVLFHLIRVAPLVGAWIEIKRKEREKHERMVAPLVGAWIEIISHMTIVVFKTSLPSWERGLKLLNDGAHVATNLVAPLVGAWIEIAEEAVKVIEEYCRSPRGSVD